jgi:hypothetical protein
LAADHPYFVKEGAGLVSAEQIRPARRQAEK